MKDNSSTGTMNSIMLFENPELLSFLLILLINLLKRKTLFSARNWTRQFWYSLPGLLEGYDSCCKADTRAIWTMWGSTEGGAGTKVCYTIYLANYAIFNCIDCL